MSGILGPVPKRPVLPSRITAHLTVRNLRRLITMGAAGAVAAVVVALGCSQWIRSSADGHIYDTASVPSAPVAIVLGAQVDPNGQPSAFLAARLEIARQLLEAGKVKAILVSGDHGRWAYDEPGAMQNWLVTNGVPADRVALDHAGFDTYDSCTRASRIFGVRQAIVVTQDFHLPRAVALCREQGIDATGVGDSSVRVFEDLWLRGEVREYGAAVKAAADVLSSRDPVFLGPYETSVDKAVSRS